MSKEMSTNESRELVTDVTSALVVGVLVNQFVTLLRKVSTGQEVPIKDSQKDTTDQSGSAQSFEQLPEAIQKAANLGAFRGRTHRKSRVRRPGIR